MVAVAHKYSVNEALTTFILASDGESNDSFGDESSLESWDRYDSEGEPWFCGTEFDEIQENDYHSWSYNLFQYWKLGFLLSGLFEIQQLATNFLIPISHGLYIFIKIYYFLCNDMLLKKIS